MSVLDRVRSPAVLLGLSLTACMVRLNDPYKSYSADGDVSGPPNACTAPPAEGPGAPTGAAAPRIVGRTATDPGDPKGTTRIGWSGTTVTARFTGATNVYLKVQLTNGHVNTPTTDPGEHTAPKAVFYSAGVDGAPPTTVTVDGTQAGVQMLSVATALSPGLHEITIVRESDVQAGSHLFYGLYADEAGTQPLAYAPATVRPRRIQIIGDSISCGAGVLGANAACTFDYGTERVGLTYGALAALSLDADLTNISSRDVGVLKNRDGSTDLTMPTLYQCADPSVTPCIAAGDLSKDPAPPQAIVVLLGTNDLARAGGDPGAFGGAYETFVRGVRALYPQAHIFCALSPMLTDLNTGGLRTSARNALHGAVADLADAKVYALDFPDQGTENGLGCEENPSTKTHEIMADILATALREKTCW